MRGVVRDSEGVTTDAGAPDLPTEVETQILTDATKRYQAGPTRGNSAASLQEALSAYGPLPEVEAGAGGSMLGDIGRALFTTNMFDVAKNVYQDFMGNDEANQDNVGQAAALKQAEAPTTPAAGQGRRYTDPDSGVTWIQTGPNPNDPNHWTQAPDA